MRRIVRNFQISIVLQSNSVNNVNKLLQFLDPDGELPFHRPRGL